MDSIMAKERVSVLCYMRKQPLEMDLLPKGTVSGQLPVFIAKKIHNWDRSKVNKSFPLKGVKN